MRHRFLISPIWETPWAKGGTGWQRQLLGGYSLVGVFTTRSGTPFSAFDSTYNINIYLGVPRIVPSTPITQYSTGSPSGDWSESILGLEHSRSQSLGAVQFRLGT